MKCSSTSVYDDANRISAMCVHGTFENENVMKIGISIENEGSHEGKI
jgi:hypothetical protein